MIRVAAVGDLHYDRSSRNRLRSYFEDLHNRADIFLIAGDLRGREDWSVGRAVWLLVAPTTSCTSSGAVFDVGADRPWR